MGEAGFAEEEEEVRRKVVGGSCLNSVCVCVCLPVYQYVCFDIGVSYRAAGRP